MPTISLSVLTCLLNLESSVSQSDAFVTNGPNPGQTSIESRKLKVYFPKSLLPKDPMTEFRRLAKSTVKSKRQNKLIEMLSPFRKLVQPHKNQNG